MVSEKAGALRHSFLFSSLNDDSIHKIVKIAHLKNYHKNEIVFQEGDPALGFYIVGKGRIKIYKLSVEGAEHILHLVGDGGSFAEAVVFGRLNHYPAFAEAVSDSQAVFINKKEFLSLMKSDFDLTLSVLSSMSEKLKYFNTLVEELSLKSADSRLSKYLLDLSVKNKSDSFRLDARKSELAKRLGIVPETLSRILRRLKNKRVIRIAQDKITLLDKKILFSLSCGEKS